jgi:hypothetical protein
MLVKTSFLLVALTVCAGLGCEDGTDEPGQAEQKAVDPIVSRWKVAGLSVGASVTLNKSKVGQSCTRYDVQGVTSLLCDFEDPQSAEAGRERGLAWIGDATGAALLDHNRLLVVSDRDGVDPNGKAINQITKLFLKAEAPAEAPASVAKPVDEPAKREQSAGLGSLIPKVGEE